MASILEIPLSEVPEFSQDNEQFIREVQAWLGTMGLCYVQVAPDEPTLLAAFESGEADGVDIWSTIEGVSPRGGQHACVALNGEIAFDPHPPNDGTGRGLVSITCFGLLCKRFA